MASTQISPGVVVLERDLTNSVNATVDNVAAIVGTFEKGPVEEVRTISNERQLIEEFGNRTTITMSIGSVSHSSSFMVVLQKWCVPIIAH